MPGDYSRRYLPELRGRPVRRVGQPDEVGATIATLLSDDTSYVTGQIIAVDCGAVIR
jgi:NAD(P)-dependent dehydrogenase (short-subunit alcohol dehydrogenase family)